MLKTLHGDVQGTSLADWPISYDDLEPFLTKVEWEFGCTGLDGADKYAPHRSRPYPSAPLPPTKFAKVFYDACKKMDINGFPLPHAMVTNAHKGRVANNYTGFWNQYGDPSGTRSNAATTFIPEALATGKCELRPDSYCVRVLTNAKGEANGVVYLDEEGAEHCPTRKTSDSLPGRNRIDAVVAALQVPAPSARTCQWLWPARQERNVP